MLNPSGFQKMVYILYKNWRISDLRLLSFQALFNRSNCPFPIKKHNTHLSIFKFRIHGIACTFPAKNKYENSHLVQRIPAVRAVPAISVVPWVLDATPRPQWRQVHGRPWPVMTLVPWFKWWKLNSWGQKQKRTLRTTTRCWLRFVAICLAPQFEIAKFEKSPQHSDHLRARGQWRQLTPQLLLNQWLFQLSSWSQLVLFLSKMNGKKNIFCAQNISLDPFESRVIILWKSPSMRPSSMDRFPRSSWHDFARNLRGAIGCWQLQWNKPRGFLSDLTESKTESGNWDVWQQQPQQQPQPQPPKATTCHGSQ